MLNNIYTIGIDDIPNLEPLDTGNFINGNDIIAVFKTNSDAGSAFKKVTLNQLAVLMGGSTGGYATKTNLPITTIGQTSFSIPVLPSVALLVTLNGIEQDEGTDYTINNITNILTWIDTLVLQTTYRLTIYY